MAEDEDDDDVGGCVCVELPLRLRFFQRAGCGCCCAEGKLIGSQFGDDFFVVVVSMVCGDAAPVVLLGDCSDICARRVDAKENSFT